MSEPTSSSIYADTTYAPVSHPDELKMWWQRKLPNQEQRPIAYRPYKVKVTDRKKDGARDYLTFILADEENQPSPRPFTVELPIDTRNVWPDLPSTAQLVEPGKTPPYGFLFLSDEWADRNQVPRPITVASGGQGKWPIAGGRNMAPLLDAMQDDTLREKLLDALDDIKRDVPSGSRSK